MTNIDLIAQLDERALAASANRLKAEMTRAGQVSGQAFNEALLAEAGRSRFSADQLRAQLEGSFGDSGRRAGRGFGRSFGSELVQSLPGVGGFASAMSGYEGVAGKAGAAAGRALGMAFTTAAAGLIGAAGYTLFKGFERYEAIDAAKNRLQNLNATLAATGRATIDVGKVMATVNRVVEGTPFALDQAFSIATTALSSSTGDLNRFMTAVANTAGFLQQPIDSVGQAFLNVAAKGKVSMEELSNQLQGLPLDWIAQTVGVSTGELVKMMEEGKVGLDDLLVTVERNLDGFAKGSVNTVSGAMEQVQTAVARLGANFLGAIFGAPTDDANGLVEALNSLQARIDDINRWVTAHKGDIQAFFQQGVDAAKALAGAIETVKTVCDELGIGIDDVVIAFVAWQSIKGVATLTTALGGINTMLKTTLPASATTAAASMTAALGPVAALLATLYVATEGDPGQYLTPGGDKSAVTRAEEGRWGELFMGDSWNWIKRQLGMDTGETFGGSGSFAEPPKPPGDMPAIPGRGLHWEDGKGWVPDAGPAGSPIQPAPGLSEDGGSGLPKAPQLPLPAEYGQPPRPGESVEAWKERMNLIEARHDVAEKEARVQQLERDSNATENDIIRARNDAIQSRVRVQELERKQIAEEAKVPLPAELGQGPRPGETVEAWRHRMDVLQAQHDVAQKQADLNQLERSGTATQDELTQARYEFIEAQAALNEAYTKNLKETSGAFEQFGAELDKDFGISKGLAGIAENLTKFLANLAFAPVFGALNAVVASDPRKGGHGLMGMLAAQGAFGPNFTGLEEGASTSGPWYDPSGSGQQPVAASSNSAQPAARFSAGAPNPGESARDFAHRVMKPYFESQGLTVGDHAADQYGEHQNGALDIMVPSIAEGQKVLQQVLADPNTYGAIFDNKVYGYGQGLTPRDYSAGHTGNPTQDHQDHVHAWYKPGGKDNIPPGAVPPDAAFGPGSPSNSSASYGGGSFPIPLPVTIVGGDGASLFGSLPGAVGQSAGGPGLATPASTSGLNWDALMQKEAGGSGGWKANTGNGYYGGLQFDQATWNQYKLPGFPERADLASKEQQIAAAENALKSGRTPQSLWPNTHAALGPGPGAGGGPSVPMPAPGPGRPGFVPGVGFVDSQGNPTGYNPTGPAAPSGPGPLPTSAPSGEGFAPMGAPAPSTRIGAAVEPPAGTSGGGNFGITPGGTIDTAINMALAAANVAAFGAPVGQAAQTGIKLAERAIQYGGQAAGIGVQGLMETFLPTGGSELAQNNWITRIAGGLAGASVALPNLAGKATQPTAEQVAGVDPNAQQPQGQGPPPGPQGDTNITVNNQRATEDGTGRDILHYWQNQGPGMG